MERFFKVRFIYLKKGDWLYCEKKISLIVICFSLFSLMLFGYLYSFHHKFNILKNEVIKVEIIEIDLNGSKTLICSIENEEKVIEFLKDFSNIKFKKYFFGDPMEIYGKTIKLVYKNENYELVTFNFSRSYNKNHELQKFGRKYCNESIFNNLINKYLNNIN